MVTERKYLQSRSSLLLEKVTPRHGASSSARSALRKCGQRFMNLAMLARSETARSLILATLLAALLPLLMPNIAHGAGVVRTADEPTFEIKISKYNLSQINSLFNKDKDPIEVDPVALRKESLRKYFTEVRPSRFVGSVDTLAEQPHWRKVIAISFVESTLGKRCYFNNCWGITYSSGLAKFKTLDEGIKVHNDLIARRYADKTYQQMNCVYVQPCNPRWVKGVLQIEAELDKYVEPTVKLQ